MTVSFPTKSVREQYPWLFAGRDCFVWIELLDKVEAVSLILISERRALEEAIDAGQGGWVSHDDTASASPWAYTIQPGTPGKHCASGW